MVYYQVKVQFTVEDSKGKVKKQNILYLVDAQSVTEAEARTIQFLNDAGEQEFEVKAASESAIAQVIESDEDATEIK
jgi:Fe-S cluster assembly iron-binding protein IscA